jgi:hypothetical protein
MRPTDVKRIVRYLALAAICEAVTMVCVALIFLVVR